MDWYAIHAVVLTEGPGGRGSRQIGTFYLNARVQGILTTDHAVRVAKEIINPLGIIQDDQLVVTAYRVAQL